MLAYLARYTHRVAISNSRLVAADDHGVTFRYKVRVVSEIDGGMFTIGDGAWTRLTGALAPR